MFFKELNFILFHFSRYIRLTTHIVFTINIACRARYVKGNANLPTGAVVFMESEECNRDPSNKMLF